MTSPVRLPHPAPPTVSELPEGQLSGKAVKRFRLANNNGMVVEILNYGGVVVSVEFPDKSGRAANLVLGYPDLAAYVKYNSAPTPHNPGARGSYFGAVIGRFANRVAGGAFELNGTRHQVVTNVGSTALHGGQVGFDQKVWSAAVFRRPAADGRPTGADEQPTGADEQPTGAGGRRSGGDHPDGEGGGVVGVRLEYVSPDGEMGFPGRLVTVATYTLDNQDRLTLQFEATTDAPTVVNLTNHTYWNLAGEASGAAYGHLLRLNADHYTPIDASLMPTGEISPVAGTPFDFREFHPIGERIRANHPQLAVGHGYDHNWVLNQAQPGSLTHAAAVVEPGSGRRLDLYTTQPGCQFYTGNFLDGTIVGSSGHSYRQSDGFALETQHFPDSPNQPGFPSTELEPGQTYAQTTVYKLSCEN
ncbi:MAG TPA: aldose epimerase family protein [Acidimicrobiales bacterium]|nr:aldose epimerase family protein [Acidimicrobiales bacterium]